MLHCPLVPSGEKSKQEDGCVLRSFDRSWQCAMSIYRNALCHFTFPTECYCCPPCLCGDYSAKSEELEISFFFRVNSAERWYSLIHIFATWGQAEARRPERCDQCNSHRWCRRWLCEAWPRIGNIKHQWRSWHADPLSSKIPDVGCPGNLCSSLKPCILNHSDFILRHLHLSARSELQWFQAGLRRRVAQICSKPFGTQNGTFF